MITVQRRLELLKVVAQFLQDNFSGDCSGIEPPTKQRGTNDIVYGIRVFASKRLDMAVSEEEAKYVDRVLSNIFEQTFHEGTQ